MVLRHEYAEVKDLIRRPQDRIKSTSLLGLFNIQRIQDTSFYAVHVMQSPELLGDQRWAS